MSKDDDDKRKLAEELKGISDELLKDEMAKAMSLVPLTVPQMAMIAASLDIIKEKFASAISALASDPDHPAYVMAVREITEISKVIDLMRKHGDDAVNGHTPQAPAEVVQLRAVPKNNDDNEVNGDDSAE